MSIIKLINLCSIKNILRLIVLILISIHQAVLKPLFGSHARCRFNPTCSEYVKIAFQSHPPLTAFVMSLKRLLKCHPFGSYGYDPVQCSNLDHGSMARGEQS